MVKSIIQQKLEELYEAQERYLQLRLDFEKFVRKESPEYIPLGDVLGEYDEGMESVCLAMVEFERQMQTVGEAWEEEQQPDISLE